MMALAPRRSALCPILAVILILFVAPGKADVPARLVTLSGGTRLVLKPDLDSDTLVLSLFIREEPTETPAQEAVRRMVNASVYFSTVHLSYDAVIDAVNKLGAVTTRQTPNYLSVSCVTSASQYRNAIYLLCEGIKNAQFDAEALERARVQLLKQNQERDQSPFLSAYDRVCQAISERPEPNEVHLRHVTPADAQGYFHTHFIASRTVFSAAGKFDTAALQKSLDNNLFDYDRRGVAVKTRSERAGAYAKSGETLHAETSGSVSYALIAAATPPLTSPDYPAICVLSTLLGGGHSSRMFQDLREKSGIGYSVGTALRAEDDAPLTAYVEWETVKEANRKLSSGSAILEQMTSLIDELTVKDPKISDSEIERARNFAAGQYLLRHERVQERSFLPGWYECMGMGYAYDAAFPDRLKAVTKADILRVASQYLPHRVRLISEPKSAK